MPSSPLALDALDPVHGELVLLFYLLQFFIHPFGVYCVVALEAFKPSRLHHSVRVDGTVLQLRLLERFRH